MKKLSELFPPVTKKSWYTALTGLVLFIVTGMFWLAFYLVLDIVGE